MQSHSANDFASPVKFSKPARSSIAPSRWQLRRQTTGFSPATIPRRRSSSARSSIARQPEIAHGPAKRSSACRLKTAVHHFVVRRFRWKVRQPEPIQVNRSVNDLQGWNIRRFGENPCLTRACRTRNDQQRFRPRSAPYANLPCVPISRAGKHKMGPSTTFT